MISAFLSMLGALSPCVQAADAPQQIFPRDWLVIGALEQRGKRRPFRADAVFARYLLVPTATPPAEGEQVVGELGSEQAWRAVQADEEGALAGGSSWGYSALEVSPDEAGVWMADLQGAHTLFVNGDGFVGDYYAAYGSRGVPVELRAGTNHLFLTGTRGAPRLRFWRPTSSLFLGDWGLTLPQLVEGEAVDTTLGALIVNATVEALEGVTIELRLPASGEWLTPTTAFPLAPLCIANPAVPLRTSLSEGPLAVRLEPVARGLEKSAALGLDIELGRAAPDAQRTLTYRSKIDDSAQIVALRPPVGGQRADGQGLVLSLHGAGVNAPGQAAAYASYKDLWIAAPNNRRMFGFDWQDWGRRDAYEALAHVLEISGASEERLYLTGHSMGGHGAWHLAANDPDRWAAVAPSAGWVSFDTYGPRPAGELASLWHDADAASLTLELTSNLAQLPLFVLHGEMDDNVPPSEARTMLAALAEEGVDVAHHFQTGAGHWWDGDAAPGADCLTWPGIFELFATNRRDAEPRELEFVSVDPGVDAQHFWIRVVQHAAYGESSRVHAQHDPEARRIRLVTHNVRRLEVTPPKSFEVERLLVDGFHFDVRGGTALRSWSLLREAGVWRMAAEASAGEKNARQHGPFKRAFDNRFVLVYGTRGTQAETHTLLARARFDAETWWYRANGHTLVLSDEEFLKDEMSGRNVIVYGNLDTNAAWGSLLPESSPVRARRGEIVVGKHVYRGDDLMCLFIQPRRGDPASVVGVFADSGLRGARLGYTFQTFISGAGFPDLALVDSSVLKKGDGGVLAAGFFDARWGLPGLRVGPAGGGAGSPRSGTDR